MHRPLNLLQHLLQKAFSRSLVPMATKKEWRKVVITQGAWCQSRVCRLAWSHKLSDLFELVLMLDVRLHGLIVANLDLKKHEPTCVGWLVRQLLKTGAEATVVAIRGVVSRYPVAALAPEQTLLSVSGVV